MQKEAIGGIFTLESRTSESRPGYGTLATVRMPAGRVRHTAEAASASPIPA